MGQDHASVCVFYMKQPAQVIYLIRINRQFITTKTICIHWKLGFCKLAFLNSEIIHLNPKYHVIIKFEYRM
jgi:hypothetical protein